ncbi:MAG TPA: hypothetical protein VGN98_10970 [Tianweitania sediminis]|jgi:hypothetical protein|nr:hypothetical protein [Tianweitania sediminis]
MNLPNIPTHKSYMEMEPDLLDAICALKILCQRLEARSSDDEQECNLYMVGQALGHLQRAVAPLPEPASPPALRTAA